MPGFARQHFSTAAVPPCQRATLRVACQLIYGKREDDLVEDAVYEQVIRDRAQAANRHHKAEMLKAKPEGRSVLTS
jgi:hypothetical protein